MGIDWRYANRPRAERAGAGFRQGPFGGGVDNNNNVLASAEVFSSSTNTWTLTGSMTDARETFPAVVLKSGKVLVSGGLGTGGVVSGSAELYDPSTGVWSSAGTFSVARFGHTATLLPNGMVLVAGGCTSSCSTITAASELYNPATNNWSTTDSLNLARYSHIAVRLNTGMVLAIGGSNRKRYGFLRALQSFHGHVEQRGQHECRPLPGRRHSPA